ncbi:hypothetical protein Lal_00039811 [Lupinus albus]|nr:hypothetical protein Lal_00039811 [Lupinus albus]
MEVKTAVGTTDCHVSQNHGLNSDTFYICDHEFRILVIFCNQPSKLDFYLALQPALKLPTTKCFFSN